MAWRIIREALGLPNGAGSGLRAALDGALDMLGLGSEITRKRGAVAIAVISLSAKMAKADGIASHIEANVFERVFSAEPDEIANVRRVFDLAKQDIAGFEAYAGQIASRLGEDTALKHDIYEGLFHIAAADGILHPLEDEYLARVAGIFGFTPEEHRMVRARFVRDPEDPYIVLGADRSMSDAALKAHHREVVRECHPDVLIAHGMPDELVALAGRKLAAINAAWERIARERGL